MTRAYVIGCDPGKLSGLSLVALDETDKISPLFAKFRPRLVMCSSVKMRDFPAAVREYLDATPDDAPLVVSCERYVVTRRSQQTQDTQSLEMTGSLTAVLAVLGRAHQWVQYMPSQAKTHWPDGTMRAMGLDIAHTTDHARDAVRHALEWCMRYAHAKEDL